ncbi:MAG: acetyl-CoA carboxylase biotin carboxylase subunit [Bacteroidia bacterium]|nr:acetyl-CoA carboxylase biotin carboxylase subunit [Bacteroidia bacterium]
MKSINSILIANRGEIASRVIRSCKKLGIRSIAVFSDADRNMPFVKEADIAVHIGASSPSQSYLDQDKIISTAKRTGADAIHPGYGFLSENAAFARKCESEGIIFIGPHPKAIEAMGSKSQAKDLMQKFEVPVVPGYQGKDQSIERLTQAAREVGYPLLLKATAGGGGKGMRIVHEESEIEAAIAAAKRESKSAFGDDELIVEKYIASGRHIEFQIFGDKQGNAIHILERECSIQRRYQKVVEESPSPIMSEDLRTKMGAAAVNAAKALSYDNAGTVEFIYDDKSGDFYFLEVNTRLQVEHPVTEEISGLDLVQMQIESASGKELSIKQEDIQGKGYALELRLYAEDAAKGFLPVTGRILKFEYPEVEGLRVESAIESGSEISIFYDPMIAKLIVWDESREGAHRKMEYVLKNMRCQGMMTNQDFLLALLEHPDFRAGKYDTHFISQQLNYNPDRAKSNGALHQSIMAACLAGWVARENKRVLLAAVPSGWRNNFNDHQLEKYSWGGELFELKYRYLNNSFSMSIGEENYTLQFLGKTGDQLQLEIDGLQQSFSVISNGSKRYIHNEQFGNVELELQPRFPQKESEKEAGGYEAPMPSQIVKVLVKAGEEVESGAPLMIISSMKMENTIEAVADGKVEEIFTTEGANVEAGFLLLKIKT